MRRPLPSVLSALLLTACGARSPLDGPDPVADAASPDVTSCDGGRCGSGPYRSYSVTTPTEPFVDACQAPGHTAVLRNQDDSTERLTLPFDVQVFGTFGRAVWVSSNGVVGFGSAAVPTFGSSCTPGADNGFRDTVLMAFLDDLHTRDSGVCIATVGTAPRRRFVVTWSNAYFCCSSGAAGPTDLTFSALIDEGTDVLTVQFQTLLDSYPGNGARASGSEAALGVQSLRGAVGTIYSCARPNAVYPGTALRYTPVL